MSNPSTDLARAVVTALIEGGVRDIVVAPGSRNAPLSFAAYDAAAAGLVRLHSRLDERGAGFLALGMAKVSHRPAAVICTSGTAVANLHPAVLEAFHSGIALVVVTADRPDRLRGTSANQTTDQVGLFGPQVATRDLRAGDSLAAAEIAGSRSPLHLNVGFDEPLLPDGATEEPWAPTTERPLQSWWQPEGMSLALPPGPRTVVVAGDDAGPPARMLAQQGNWPLFAEPSSGSRTGANAMRCYRLLLDGELGQRIERVIVAGHPTLSRPITRLLNRADVEVWDCPGRGLPERRPFAVAGSFSEFSVELPDEPEWLDEWRAADRLVGERLDGLLAAEVDLTPHEVAGAVSRALPPGGLLYVGASSPIRDLDLMVAKYSVGDRRKVIANRGLAGIDGSVSTAIGAALGRPSGTRNLALLGDVTFLHDATALFIGPDEAVPDLTFVVVNDDGGAIFTMLEQGAPEHAARYDKLFGTPHGVDLASLCAASRTPHWRVESLTELEHALASPAGGIEVVEVVVRRDNRRDLDARIRALGAGL